MGRARKRSGRKRGGKNSEKSGGVGEKNDSKKQKHVTKKDNYTKSKPRFKSYVEKLKSGEKELENVRDAQQFFKVLSRDFEDSKRLTLNFDEEMESVLKDATDLLHPDLKEPLKLLAAMGGEALTHGVYKGRSLRCFKILYGATDFMKSLTQQLKTGQLGGAQDHSTIAWFILQLGKSGN